MLKGTPRVLGPFASRIWPLASEALKAKVRRKTGLSDFGDGAPLNEPLRLLCRSLDEDAEFPPAACRRTRPS